MNKTLILVGNPNVGKSVIFGKFTGRYAVVSNYPGTTVDLSRGMMISGGATWQIIDTPGTNSLMPVSEDEQVTRDVLLRENPDVIVQVADAKNLARTLQLTLELIELGVPMALALNMHDEARDRGIHISVRRLSDALGIPVVATVGVTGEGISDLKKAVSAARAGTVFTAYSQEIEELAGRLDKLIPERIRIRRALALMLAADDDGAWSYVPPAAGERIRSRLREELAGFPQEPRLMIFNRRNMMVNEIVAQVQETGSVPPRPWLARLGNLAMRPFPGYAGVAAVLFAMYLFVGVLGVGIFVDLMQSIVFGRYINPPLAMVIERFVASPFLREFLIGPYGIFSMAVTYAFAIVLPIVGTFFLFFGLLEDSGYLPRLSVMTDRLFRAFGLNGKAVLPLILGLGCGTMAAISSRILETRRERLLVMILLSLTIPCSAQLGVILGMLAGLSWKVTVIWLLSILISIYGTGAAAHRLIPGEESAFIMEIPPLRVPSFTNIVMKVRMRMVWYLKEAVPLFILGTAILFFMDRIRFLGVIERAASPVVVHFLGLPAETTRTFLIGFLRRDYGAAGLFSMAKEGLLDPRQILISIVTITLFVPCIAQCFMVVKEQGWKYAVLIFIFVAAYAVLFSGAINAVVGWLGIL